MARLRKTRPSSNVVDKTGLPSPFWVDPVGRVRFANEGDEYLMKFYEEDQHGFSQYNTKEKELLKQGVDLNTILFLRALRYDGNLLRKGK